MRCHVVQPFDVLPDAIHGVHDPALQKLSEEYNALIEPFLGEREDGKVLRVFTPDEGAPIFIWAMCYGVDVTLEEIEAKHGPLTDVRTVSDLQG